MKFIDIGEVARLSGNTPATLRYYEEKGLIESASRHGLRRQFGEDTLLLLALISLGKTAGFTLKEISLMFSRRGQLNLPRRALQQRADAIEGQIKRLTTLRKALLHVSGCKAPSHLECPKFRRLIRMSVRKQRVQS